jgi:hypothetical protein
VNLPDGHAIWLLLLGVKLANGRLVCIRLVLLCGKVTDAPLLDSRCSRPDLLSFWLGVCRGGDDDADVVRTDASLSLVKSDSDDVLSTLTNATSLWLFLVPPISARRRRTCWRMNSFALSDFENPARIMAHGTLTPVVVWRTLTAKSTFF